MLSDRKDPDVKRRLPKIIRHKGKTPCRRKAGESIVFILLYMSLYLSALAISVVMCAQNSDLYLKIQNKCGLFTGFGALDRSEVLKMNEELTAYLSGNTAYIENASVRANTHMQDVRRIFDGVKGAGGLLIALSAFWMYMNRKAKAKDACIFGWTPLIMTCVIVLFLQRSDFSIHFQRFHETFFDNDLWRLDPNEDFMIRCLPEEFFYRMAMAALFYALIVYGGFAFISILLFNKIGRRDSK